MHVCVCRPPRCSFEDEQLVCYYQLLNASHTLKQIRETMIAQHSIKISLSTIHRILNDNSFTTKNLQYEPVSRNSDENILQRAHHCREMLTLPTHTLVYIDEAGFNLHTNRKRGIIYVFMSYIFLCMYVYVYMYVCVYTNVYMYVYIMYVYVMLCVGRSIIGQRATIETPNSKGGNISVCAAMSPTYGLMHYKIIFGSYKSATYVDFLNELFDKCDIFKLITHHLVMDNASIHKTNEVRECIAAGVQQRNSSRTVLQKQVFLPPYSPHLNPIEQMWSAYKSHVKREEKTDRPGLIALMNEAATKIEQAQCDGYYRDTVRWYTHCIDNQPL